MCFHGLQPGKTVDLERVYLRNSVTKSEPSTCSHLTGVDALLVSVGMYFINNFTKTAVIILMVQTHYLYPPRIQHQYWKWSEMLHGSRVHFFVLILLFGESSSSASSKVAVEVAFFTV